MLSASCGIPAKEKLSVNTSVEITLKKEVNEKGIYVYGITNLPDGALLFIQISSLKPSGVIEWKGFAWKIVQVRNGQYSAYFDLKKWKFEPGKKQIWVAFMIHSLPQGRKQPDFIIRAFGEKGEQMKGKLVYEFGDSGEKIAEVADTFYWQPPSRGKE